MSTPNLIAPTGAILTLLAIAERAAVPADEAVDAWLATNELVGPNEGGIIDLTERGRVWLGMIMATPLPVPIARWGDPRATVTINPALFPPKPEVARPAGRVAGDDFTAIDYSPRPPTIPPGFTANTFGDLEIGKLPPGLQRDTELEVVLANGHKDRNGRYLKLFAGQVIFKRQGKVDDVIAYRVIPGETLLVAGG